MSELWYKNLEKYATREDKQNKGGSGVADQAEAEAVRQPEAVTLTAELAKSEPLKEHC